MQAVKLTNYGSLVLRSILREHIPTPRSLRFQLDKTNLLAKHWPDSASQETFTSTFWTSLIAEASHDHIYTINEEQVNLIIMSRESGEVGDQQPADLSLEMINEWENMGLVQTFVVQTSMQELSREISLASTRSPIRYINDVLVELTGICNLGCQRCYRGGSKPFEFGLPINMIKSALRPLLMLNTSQVTVTGGEPTIRKNELFDLIEFVKDYMLIKGVPDKDEEKGYYSEKVVLLSNGTFDEPRSVLGQLKEIGNVVLRVSLASYDERTTDEESNMPGTYAKIRNLVLFANELEMPILLMAHELGNVDNERTRQEKKFFAERCFRVTTDPAEKIHKFGKAGLHGFGTVLDPNPLNYFGNLNPTEFAHMPGWCRCLYEPHHLFIRPNGNVGPCFFTYQLEQEFGNLYERSMIEIINGIHVSPIHRLFAGDKVQEAQFLVDQNIFPGPYGQACEPMAICLTFAQLYEKYLAQGMSKEEAQRLANNRTAELTGYKR